MTDEERAAPYGGVISAQCPFCEWSARQQVTTEEEAMQCAPFLVGALDMHVQLAHGESRVGLPQTYRVVTVGNVAAIHCLLCNRISELPGDIENHYCGRCHLFHDVVADARRAHAAGATHDCGEWRTSRGRCAVCDRVL